MTVEDMPSNWGVSMYQEHFNNKHTLGSNQAKSSSLRSLIRDNLMNVFNGIYFVL